MDWLEEVQTAFADKEYMQRSMLFFEREGILEGGNKEQWEKFFKKVQLWGKTYLERKDAFKLYGVNGWFLNLTFWVMHYPKDSPQEIEDYFYRIKAVYLFYPKENEFEDFYEIFDFVKDIQNFWSWQDEENMEIFLDTEWREKIERLFQQSWERFQDCEEDKDFIEGIKPQYAKFQRYFLDFKKEVKDCDMVCVNITDDYAFWYFVKSAERFYLIRVTETI